MIFPLRFAHPGQRQNVDLCHRRPVAITAVSHGTDGLAPALSSAGPVSRAKILTRYQWAAFGLRKVL